MVEGIAILLVYIFSVVLERWYQSRMNKLKDHCGHNLMNATVLRGGVMYKDVPFTELVVGDIVQLHKGDIVPADCIVLEEEYLEVNQGIYFDQLATKQSKDTYDAQPDDPNEFPDPFLFTRSKVTNG